MHQQEEMKIFQIKCKITDFLKKYCMICIISYKTRATCFLLIAFWVISTFENKSILIFLGMFESMRENVLYVCTGDIPKSVSDPLDLEQQVIISLQTWVLVFELRSNPRRTLSD